MNPRKKFVLKIVLEIAVFQAVMTILFFAVPQWFNLNVLEWEWVCLSSITSFFAIVYVVKGWFYATTTADDMRRRTGDLFGTEFIRRLGEIGRKVERRYSAMPTRERERILNLLDKGVDAGIDALLRLSRPKPKRKRVRRIR